MARKPKTGAGRRSRSVPTPDELVVHLREAGARCVYVSRAKAFQVGTVPITATYELADDAAGGESAAETVHEQLASVFEAIGDRIWFHDREWDLEGTVEPAFPDQRLDLVPLYDRRVERRHGDGFFIRTLRFVYVEQRA